MGYTGKQLHFNQYLGALVRAERLIVSSHCDHSPLKCPCTRKRRASILCIKELIPNIHMIFVGSDCSVREYDNWFFYRLKALFEVRIFHQNWNPKSLRTIFPGDTCYFLQLNSSVLSVVFFSGPQVGKLDLPMVPELQHLFTHSLCF